MRRVEHGSASLPSGDTPPFSAIVAAWNEAHGIAGHIRSFLDLAWPHCELIVCAGGDDGTLDVAMRAAEDTVVILEQRPGEGKQRALRRCLERAQHPIIYLTDADCLFDRDAVSAVIAPLASGAYEVATGGSRPLPHQTRYPLVQYQQSRDAAFFDRQGDEMIGILGRNAALTRRCLDTTGAMHVDVSTGTDFFLSTRLKALHIPIAHAVTSRIESEYPVTATTYVQMWRRWIKNLVVHDTRGQWWPVGKSVVLALLILGLPVSWSLLPWYVAAFASLPLVLSLASRYRDLRTSARNGTAIRPATYALVPYYLVLDQLAVVGALFDLTSGPRRSRW